MKFYHGCKYENLKIETHIRSRYGFTAIFLTPSKELAVQYAYYNYLKYGKGYLYAFEIIEPSHEIDFNNGVSHSMVFRNLVYKLQKEQHASVLIKNVIDYPSEKVANFKSFDVLIIFNLDLINGFKMIGKY